MLNDSLEFWSAIESKIKSAIKAEMRKVMQCERYTVTTAPNGTVIGVTLPSDTTELFIPYSNEVASARVGDVVLVVWRGTLTTAKAWSFGNGLDLSEFATLDNYRKVTASQASSTLITLSANTTLNLSHAGKFFWVSSTSDITITIPATDTVAFPVGTEMEFCRGNTGAVTFAGASDVTLLSVDSEKTISDQYATVAIKKINENGWLLSGSLG